MVNFFQIIMGILGLIGVVQCRRRYVVLYLVWMMVWVGWNDIISHFGVLSPKGNKTPKKDSPSERDEHIDTQSDTEVDEITGDDEKDSSSKRDIDKDSHNKVDEITGSNEKTRRRSSGKDRQSLDEEKDAAVDGSTSEKSDEEKAHFVTQHRAQLILNVPVSTVMSIVDSLGNMVHRELYAEILAEKTSMKQMRLLYTMMPGKGGIRIKAAFYNALKQHVSYLLGNIESPDSCHRKLKSSLSRRSLCLLEWKETDGNKTLLNEVFTEVYITEGGTEEVNKEHEVRQIETSMKPARPETSIQFDDIFKRLPGQNVPIRTVMMKGVAGIGKTVVTQKYALDWAEGKANQNIHFMFPFTFRELNLEKKNYSLIGLLHHYFPGIKESGIYNFNESEVVFIFDGLDECRHPLRFGDNEICTDETEPVPIDVLLTNLIKGNLLPSAQIWITTRPAAANRIPSKYVDRVTEVRGFTNTQKEEYFEKRFSDKNQAKTIISYITKSRSLQIMCHIPVFCWIIATVLGVLGTKEMGLLPKTLTGMYIHFMLVLNKQNKAKHDGKAEIRSYRNVILSLGKLAFEQLKKGNLIFYEHDLIECDFDIQDAAVYSGLFTQMYKEIHGLYKSKVFCFVHLSVQEFLAALYVFLTFDDTGVNVLSEPQTTNTSKLSRDEFETLLYQSAVDKALQSPNGHLDLFLRFLLGLSLETNQNLLQLDSLKNTSQISFQTSQETVKKYIKMKIRENPSTEKSINLFYCLNELNDHSLEKEIQQCMRSGRLSNVKLSPAQWSALVFVLLTSEKELGVFDLKKYSASEEALLRLLPVVKVSNRALLSGCNLAETCCKELSPVLSSTSSRLRELDLRNNELGDAGVILLSAGLGSQYGILEILRLSGCNLSDKCCKELSSGLSSEFSSLRELDLSNNALRDSGVTLLSVGLGSPHCILETLRLSGCLITETGCFALASALSSNPSHLRELDLTYNHPGDTGEMSLSALLNDQHCSLVTLSVDHGGSWLLKPGLKKYACELTLDPDTAHTNLSLSENKRKVTHVEKKQSSPDHTDRFNLVHQVLCREGLTGRSYWEADCRGTVSVAVAYRGIKRKGWDDDCQFGCNEKSWSLKNATNYTVWHKKKTTHLPFYLSTRSSRRLGVYLDWPAGTLSFYRVHSDTLTHLYTFQSRFTEPLYPGFLLCSSDSSVSLCQIE